MLWGKVKGGGEKERGTVGKRDWEGGGKGKRGGKRKKYQAAGERKSDWVAKSKFFSLTT